MEYRSPIRESPFSLTPWVRGLMAANAMVYLLTITVFTGSWVIDFAAFSPVAVGSRWWTFVTYMFVHGGFLHLVFNMLLLFFFGPAVEERMGGASFGLYYFTCGIGGAIFSFAIALLTPVAPFVGASAAVLGVALAFAMNWPNAPVYIFPLPVPIKVKWLVAFLAIVDLLMARTGVNDGVAHLAHLGGFLFGFIYLKSEQNVMRRAQNIVTKQRRSRSIPRQRPKETIRAGQLRRHVPKSDARSHHDDIDRVLDKISASGLESLTPEERQLLDEVSRRLRQH